MRHGGRRPARAGPPAVRELPDRRRGHGARGDRPPGHREPRQRGRSAQRASRALHPAWSAPASTSSQPRRPPTDTSPTHPNTGSRTYRLPQEPHAHPHRHHGQLQPECSRPSRCGNNDSGGRRRWRRHVLELPSTTHFKPGGGTWSGNMGQLDYIIVDKRSHGRPSGSYTQSSWPWAADHLTQAINIRSDDVKWNEAEREERRCITRTTGWTGWRPHDLDWFMHSMQTQLATAVTRTTGELDVLRVGGSAEVGARGAPSRPSAGMQQPHSRGLAKHAAARAARRRRRSPGGDSQSHVGRKRAHRQRVSQRVGRTQLYPHRKEVGAGSSSSAQREP